MPAGDRNERNGLGVVSNLLDEVGSLLDDFLKSGFGPLGGVHLVDSNDELFDAQSVSQKGVFTSLSVLGDTGFEFTDTSGNNDCSRQYDSFEKVGNLRIPQSAWEVPVIMFLMKSRCPGASMTVT
jgi:hypothetical protein